MPRSLHLPMMMIAFALAAIGGPARAQDVSELSDDARRQYVQSLKDVAGFIKDKNYSSAQERLDAMLAKRPREPQARFLKGVIETEQGHSAAAIVIFSALTEDYPELPEPYNNLAVLYAQKGELESARVALETALKTAPDWALAHENLGDIYARLAAAQYDRAAKIDKEGKTAAGKLKLVRDLLTPAAPKPAT